MLTDWGNTDLCLNYTQLGGDKGYDTTVFMPGEFSA